MTVSGNADIEGADVTTGLHVITLDPARVDVSPDRRSRDGAAASAADARPAGRIKTVPEDFQVEEMPLYEPSGEGSHLYIRFQKRNLTTDMAVRLIAGALGAPVRDVGVAGLKDRRAVTTQTISIPVPKGDTGSFDDRARALEIEGITVLEAKLHGNKLKTGHLAGNRFDIVVRGIDPARLDEVCERLRKVGSEGLPNAYGNQRFGRAGDNAERALAWLTGKESGPRDARARRFLWSSLQSFLFNAVLNQRVDDGTWTVPEEGDLLQRAGSGSVFHCEDVITDRERAARGEVCPTGPMVGVKMRWPTGRPGTLERALVDAHLGVTFDLSRTKALGEGARRPLRVPVGELQLDAVHAPGAEAKEGATLRARFVLPRGTYATTVLATALDAEGSDGPPASTAPAGEAELPADDGEVSEPL